MRLLSQDEDQADVRLTTDELLLVRELLEQYCAGRHADVSVHDAEALLRRLRGVLDRLNVLRRVD